MEKTDFENHYKHCIRMYQAFGKQVQPVYIYSWFRGWASSQVQAVPIHLHRKLCKKPAAKSASACSFTTPPTYKTFSESTARIVGGDVFLKQLSNTSFQRDVIIILTIRVLYLESLKYAIASNPNPTMTSTIFHNSRPNAIFSTG